MALVAITARPKALFAGVDMDLFWGEDEENSLLSLEEDFLRFEEEDDFDDDFSDFR